MQHRSDPHEIPSCQARPDQTRPVPCLGLGCYSLAGVYGPRDPQEFTRTLGRALDLGITLFDTADQYGNAEEILGRALATVRQRVVISTKVGLTEGAKTNLSAAHVKRSCEASLRRLSTDWIDIYYVHYDDPSTPVTETVSALADLRRAGKIRGWGVGHLPPSRVAEYVEAGGLSSMMMELSCVARDSYQALQPMAARSGAGITAFSVTGRGLLTGRIGPDHVFAVGDIRRVDPLFQRARFRSGLRVAGELARIGHQCGRTPVQVAIGWAQAQPQVTAILTGATRPEHLQENWEGAARPLAPESLAQLNAFLAQEGLRMEGERFRAIDDILGDAPVPDSAQALSDLVYVMEELILLGRAQEQAVMPIFRELWSLRGQEAHRRSQIAAIHTRLKAFR